MTNPGSKALKVYLSIQLSLVAFASSHAAEPMIAQQHYDLPVTSITSVEVTKEHVDDESPLGSFLEVKIVGSYLGWGTESLSASFESQSDSSYDQKRLFRLVTVEKAATLEAGELPRTVPTLQPFSTSILIQPHAWMGDYLHFEGTQTAAAWTITIPILVSSLERRTVEIHATYLNQQKQWMFFVNGL